jgi:hypothetical protein
MRIEDVTQTKDGTPVKWREKEKWVAFFRGDEGSLPGHYLTILMVC